MSDAKIVGSTFKSWKVVMYQSNKETTIVGRFPSLESSNPGI